MLEAIDLEGDGRDNSRHIAEELGDLYLVATMLTQIATEEGRFQVADVMRGVVTKLIRRHPHVFSDVEVTGVDNVAAQLGCHQGPREGRAGPRSSPARRCTGSAAGTRKGAQAPVKGRQARLVGSQRRGPIGPRFGRAARPRPERGAPRPGSLAACRFGAPTRLERRERVALLRRAIQPGPACISYGRAATLALLNLTALPNNFMLASFAPVAQRNRAPVFGTGCRGFESLQAY